MSDEKKKQGLFRRWLKLPKQRKTEETPADDNLIQLPQPDEAELKKKRKRRKLRIILIVVAALLVLVVLLFVLFPNLIDFDRVKRYFHYLGKRDKDGYGSISFDATGTTDCGTIGDCFVLATDGGVYLYDMYGEQKRMIEGAITEPRILTTADTALCYSINGHFFAMLDKDGDRLAEGQLDGAVLDMDMSSDGYVCYSTTQSGYKTVTTVLNRSQEKMYRFNSSTQYISACAIAPGGKYLAVAGLSELNSAFSANVTLMRTDEAVEAGADRDETFMRRVELGNRVVYDMAFLSSERLCVIAEDAVYVIDVDGDVVSTYRPDGGYLRAYAFGGSDFAALLYSRGMSGDSYELVTIGKSGDVLGSLDWTGALRDVSACGKYFAVLSDGEAVIYTSKLSEYASFEDVGDASAVLMRKDGTLFLVRSDAAALYFP